ncbi:heme exporter protein CcmD [Bacillus subtilis]|uniref:heme exporter protein CcmD n=1 Tax=Pseudochrobactrum asaccharolyticum TaxID=354351 RepID=UPI001F01A522|nr:heme exporter protein CcmD [Pseudochrobactrum asaccharolyticum]MCF7644415.1 heme exporter protein CcmD [Pseudochrobactrum asaccharolyticum]MCF7670346.1 heme exporter protein CcmD [Bacillus subtilis]
MSHLDYVLISYGVSAVVILMIVAWIAMTKRNLRAELARLEQQGIRRRSNKAK